MKTVHLILLLLPGISGYAQNQKILTGINNQVWKPFVRSFNERDDSTYRNIHSKELIRVSRDDKSVYGLEQYLPKPSEKDKKNWANWKPNIELRFIERIVSEDKAYETGFYKSSFTNAQSNEIKISYGKFIVLLRKEGGVWKILMDADGKEGTNEEIFQKGNPIDSIQPFIESSKSLNK